MRLFVRAWWEAVAPSRLHRLARADDVDCRHSFLILSLARLLAVGDALKGYEVYRFPPRLGGKLFCCYGLRLVGNGLLLPAKQNRIFGIFLNNCSMCLQEGREVFRHSCHVHFDLDKAGVTWSSGSEQGLHVVHNSARELRFMRTPPFQGKGVRLFVFGWRATDHWAFASSSRN